MDYIPYNTNSNQDKKDEYWYKLGKELCELVYTNMIINVIMSHSFGKSHKYTKNLEIDFIALQGTLDDIIQHDYPREVYSITYNNKIIPITHVFYALKDDTEHINENGQSEYFVVLLEQIKIKPKKYIKKLTDDEFVMIKQFVIDITEFIDKLLSKTELCNNEYGKKLKIELNKIKKNCDLLADIQEALTDDCYKLVITNNIT